LTKAIESGELTLEDVRAWLASVEGWGDQHVYLYSISSSLRRELTEQKIRQRVADAKLDKLWDGETARYCGFVRDPCAGAAGRRGLR
jgi:hypothetical protein